MAGQGCGVSRVTPDDRDPPARWLYDELAAMRRETTEQHQRLRADMTAGFDRIRAELVVRQDLIQDHGDRLLIIETQRAAEAQQTIRRGTWAGMLAAAALTALMKIVELIWHR